MADDIITSLEIIEKLLFPETDFWRDKYLKCLSTHVCEMLSFSAISRVVICRFFFIVAFILSSSTSVGRPERGASLKSKSPERQRANQFCHWRSVNDFSL